MKWKQIIVYLVVLVALAGYYFVETAQREKAKEEKIQSKKIFDIKKDQVESIKITRKGQKTLFLEKKNNKWSIVEPIRTEVDSFSLDNFLNSLVNLSAEKKLTIDRKEFSKFGLDKPYITIEFKIDDTWKTLKIGDKNPTGENYYAGVDKKSEVYMIASFQESSLDKKLFDLRDKRLFTLNRDKVDRIEIAENSSLIKVIKKSQNKWQSPDNLDTPIKTEKVNSLLDSLTWLRARKFVQETDDNLEKYGLKQPEIQVVLAIQKSKSQTLLIGKEKDKTQRYAKITSRPGVVLISKSIINDLPKSLKDLEDRNLLSFDTDSVQKIVISYNQHTYQLTRKDDKWLWEGAEKPKSNPDTLDVNSLLWKLKDIEYQEKAENRKYEDKQIEGSISLADNSGKLLGLMRWPRESEGEKEKKPVVLVKKQQGAKTLAYIIEKEDLSDVKDKIKTLLGTAKSGTGKPS